MCIEIERKLKNIEKKFRSPVTLAKFVAILFNVIFVNQSINGLTVKEMYGAQSGMIC